jgi:DNA-binding transcriptional LysR family regulator
MAKPTLNWETRLGRRLKLRDLHILSTVVHWGSMAKGATHLGMSQPAVSEAIASLESTLGVRLLDRNSRGIEPTIYARALLKRGDVIFDELKEVIRDIEFLANPTAGQVRIGAPESLMAGFAPAIIDQLCRRYPKVSVSVVAAQPGEQEFRELRERSVDLLLGRLFKPVSDDDVVVEILCQDAFRVVAGASSGWARRRKVALAQLMKEPWISFPVNSIVSAYIEHAFRAHGQELPEPSVTSFSTQVRLHLLETGRFLTILHDSVLWFNAQARWLSVLPIDLLIRPMPIAIFRLKKRTVSPVVQLFIEQAHETAKSFVSSRKRHTATGTV